MKLNFLWMILAALLWTVPACSGDETDDADNGTEESSEEAGDADSGAEDADDAETDDEIGLGGGAEGEGE